MADSSDEMSDVSNSSCMLSDLDLRYPTFNNWVDFRRQPAGPSPVVTTVEGDGAVLRRTRIQHANNAGLLVIGSRHTLTELLVENTDWLGSLDFPPIKIGFTSDTLPGRLTAFSVDTLPGWLTALSVVASVAVGGSKCSN
jgi:hypothetical protein